MIHSITMTIQHIRYTHSHGHITDYVTLKPPNLLSQLQVNIGMQVC
jgi:hypothetical protein